MAHERQEDFPTHLQGWSGFCKFLTWGTVGVIIVLILMALFLV
ncbi:MAG: aa3-type cytochrome c oxidase subunit IV [Rhodospirillales bacterium]